jgi:hypothetical protein
MTDQCVSNVVSLLVTPTIARVAVQSDGPCSANVLVLDVLPRTAGYWSLSTPTGPF